MKLYKDQRGIAQIVIILAVLLVAVGGGTYYFLTKSDKGSDNLTSEQKAEAEAARSACEEKYDDKDLCAFAATSTNWGEYTMRFTSTSGEGDMTMSVNGDNSHSVISGDNGEKMEYIHLNNVTYTKVAGQDTWYKFESESSTPDASLDEFKFDANDIPANFTKEGKEACGSLTCLKYTFTEDSADENGGTVKYTIWFDDKDYKPRKISGSDTNGQSYEVTFTYESVKITEPSPVVDYGANIPQ